MAVSTRVRDVASGFQAVAFLDCDQRNRRAVPATASRIVKDWRPTRDAAEQRAHELAAEHGEVPTDA